MSAEGPRGIGQLFNRLVHTKGTLGSPRLETYPPNLATLNDSPFEKPSSPHADGFQFVGDKTKDDRGPLAAVTQYAPYATRVIAGMYPADTKVHLPEDSLGVRVLNEGKIINLGIVDGVTYPIGASGQFAAALIREVMGQFDMAAYLNPDNQTWINAYNALQQRFPGGLATMQVVQCAPSHGGGYKITGAVMGGKDNRGNVTTGFTIIDPLGAGGMQPIFFEPPTTVGVGPYSIQISTPRTIPQGSRLTLASDQFNAAGEWKSNQALFPQAINRAFPNGKEVHPKDVVRFLEEAKKNGKADDGSLIIVDLL